MTRRMLALAALLPLIGSGGCAGGEPAHAEVPVPAAVEAPDRSADEPGSLTTVRSEPVVGRTGPGGATFEVALRTTGGGTHLSRQIGTRRFDLGLRVRQPDMSQYPCASCHAGSTLVPGVDRAADAHQNVQPTHPSVTGATCVTCHNPQNVAELTLGTGETTSLDHAYRLCAQCHSPQAADWAAGAHGKRVDGWQGRRVVMGCADCHDPHHPETEKRIPFDPPRIERARGGSR
jgi:hypothetical protein